MKQKKLQFKLTEMVKTTCYDLHYNKMVFKLTIKEYCLKKHLSHENLAIGAIQRIINLVNCHV